MKKNVTLLTILVILCMSFVSCSADPSGLSSKEIKKYGEEDCLNLKVYGTFPAAYFYLEKSFDEMLSNAEIFYYNIYDTENLRSEENVWKKVDEKGDVVAEGSLNYVATQYAAHSGEVFAKYYNKGEKCLESIGIKASVEKVYLLLSSWCHIYYATDKGDFILYYENDIAYIMPLEVYKDFVKVAYGYYFESNQIILGVPIYTEHYDLSEYIVNVF